MSSLNPFLDDDVADTAPQESVDFVKSSTPTREVADLSLDVIADELLKNKYVLTALELYTEIQERGKELSRLRNYFSDPTNFEQQISLKDVSASGPLYRTGSCSTFDSLDMARYSDDGVQVDERIAVLEFELRKAKETIKSLRANLTKAAEQDSPCLHDKQSKRNGKNKNIESALPTEEMKPLEMRAINYLVNEYLLNNGYKLSSITFSDENAEQDFEDWDDVGINTPKPPELLVLYRDYNNHVQPKKETHDATVMTDDVSFNVHPSVQVDDENATLIEELQKEIKTLHESNIKLQNRITTLQEEAKSAQFDLNKPAIDEASSQLPQTTSAEPAQAIEITLAKSDSHAKTSSSYHPDPSRMSSQLWNSLLKESQSTVEESWLKNEESHIRSVHLEKARFQVQAAEMRFLQCVSSLALFDKVLSVSQTPDDLVFLLSRCLPRVVPTVLLAKRDQLVPLLLSAAVLHPDLQVRNDLLHILFNLIKKPDDSQRQTILHGCTAYAEHVGADRAEEELLPQCWEQIGHKYAERRQLVAEACGAIAPFIRSEMRGSLLVSILHQMQQEEKTDSIRCSVVRSLSIIYAFLDEDDKYSLGYELLSAFLADKSSTVREATYQSLLPSMAIWAMHRRSLHSHLFDKLLKRLEDAINEQKEDNFLNEVIPITYLLPYLFSAVLSEIKVEDLSQENGLSESRILDSKRDLENPSIIFGDELMFSRLVKHFDSSVSSKIDSDSQVLLWTTHQLIPRLLKIFELLSPTFEETITSISETMELFCRLFGKNFVKEKVDPQFINSLETNVERFSTSLLPIYITSILTTMEDNRVDLHEFLFTTIVRLAQANLSYESVKVTLTLLRCKAKHHDTIVQVLWSAVMHDASEVRCAAASLLVTMTGDSVDDRLLSTRVLPALITLSTDADVKVKIASILTFCHVMINPSVNFESVERVITQLAETVACSVEGFHDEQSQDGTILGLHTVRMLLLATTTKLGAVFHPKFRDEFILPHLVAVAASNNQVADASKRSMVALAMLEAYSCLSCCFITTSLLQGSVLPALKCLHVDMESLHPEHTDAVSNLISEAERKLEQGSVTSDENPHPFQLPSLNTGTILSGSPFGQAVSTGADDAKRKILNTWDQIKAKAPTSPTVFPWKK